MIRSAEVLRNQLHAKSGTAAEKIDHVRVYPQAGGGVKLEHHHSPEDKIPKTVTFGPKDGDAFADHIVKVSGLSWNDDMKGSGKDGNRGGPHNDVDAEGASPD